jgi:hypothetical protein
MVLLLPIIYLIVEIVLGQTVIGTYGVNKTIGWAWNFCPSLPFFALVSLVGATASYGILLFLKARLNKWMSILNVIALAIILAFLWISPYDYEWCDIRLKFTILSGVFLFANFLFAIGYKLSDKNKRLDD